MFGEKGNHARPVVGMNSLPNNFTLEVEIIVEAEKANSLIIKHLPFVFG